MTIDIQKIPALSRDVLKNVLIPLNPDISISCLLNSWNSKLAQIVSSKRIQFKEAEYDSPKTASYFALNFMPSGAGKDKVVGEIDRYILPPFREYFERINSNHQESEELKIREYAEKHIKGDKKQQDYIEKQTAKIRNLRYEIKDGTPEGLYADCEAFQKSSEGSIFIKISEIGRYIKNPTQAQEHFLNMTFELYEGQTSIKSTKAESQTAEIKNVPTNCLFYSDSDELIEYGNAKKYLNSLMKTGFSRRAFISYMPLKPITSFREPLEDRKIKDRAYKYANEVIQPKIKNIVDNLQPDSVFTMPDESYELLHKYKKECQQRYNSLIGRADSILLKDLSGRFWKCLKLAVIIAAIEHPQDNRILPEDMRAAIYESEILSADFEIFMNEKPESDTERLFKYFLINKNKPLSKQDIRKQGFVNKNYFAKWFAENIEYVQEIAQQQGYIIKHEKLDRNSEQYILTDNNIGTELSPEISDTRSLIGV